MIGYFTYILSLDFPEKKLLWKIIVILDLPFQLPCQAKFLGFVLLLEIFLTDQISGFLKFQYFMKELKHKVNISMWIDIHRNNQSRLV